jgi:hypothetical protein
MFATALHPSITSIPSFPAKLVDWIPVNIAAATISDIILSYSPLPIPAQNPSPPTTPVSDSGDMKAEYTVHNITNPHPIPWSSLVEQLRDATGTDENTLPTIAMREWVARLNAVAASPDEVPGLRLLQFFENMAEEEEKHKTFDSRRTQEISGALRGCGEFNGEWMRAYVECWKGMGFMR